jgi:hypothetical protein
MVMKKGLILFAVLLIVSAPAFVQAQGMFGFSGAPLYPTGPVFPGDPVRVFTPPVFYAGWMASAKNARFGFDNVSVGSLFGGQHRWPLAGVWFGLEEKVNVTPNCSLVLDGWLLVPTTRKGGEPEEVTRSFLVPIGTSGTFATVTTTAIGGREWDTDPDWWYVDAMGICGCSRGFGLVGGFRYDHFSTRFKNPQDTIVIPSTPEDRADITVNAYLPYVGFQYNQGGPSGNINVRLIGFPYAPADVSHRETGEAGTGTIVRSVGTFKDSYFLELFADANRNVFGSASLGVFFRWNWLHGRANLHSEVQPGHQASTDDSAHFDRNTVTVGGSLTVPFATPY